MDTVDGEILWTLWMGRYCGAQFENFLEFLCLQAKVCNIPVCHTVTFLVASTGNLNVVIQNCERSRQVDSQTSPLSTTCKLTNQRTTDVARTGHNRVPLSDGLYSKLITTRALNVQEQKQTGNKRRSDLRLIFPVDARGLYRTGYSRRGASRLGT